jgi:hypothetical protein
MAITDSQKVDYLYKKLGYGVAKTDTSAVKSPSNEGNASPLLIRGDTLWVSSGNVPASAPSSNTSIVAVYTGTAAVKTVNDGTSSTNRTWLTNLPDWIGSEFGATYQPRVWAAPSATANAAASGTRLFPDGSGNNDSWFFDPQSGILNFADTNVPTSVAGNVVFIEGYRYIGPKGVANATGNIIFSNVTITNNFANANIYLTPTGSGQVVVNSNLTANAGIQNTVIGNTGAAAGYFTSLTSTNFNTNGNATINGLTVNNSVTIGSTLGVTGNVTANYFIGNFAGNISGNFTSPGSNTQILFNDAGIDGASSGLTFNKTGNILSVGGNSFVVSGNRVSINSGSFIPNAALQINSTDSILLPKGTDFQRPSMPNVGMFRFSTSSNKVEWYNGTIWQAPVTDFTLTTSNAQSGTGSQTVFTLPVSNATTAGTIVSVNGIVQRPVDAYSITGANLTFTEAPSVTDIVDFRIFTTTSSITAIADVYGNTGVFVDQITGDQVIRLKTAGSDSLKVEANTRVTVTGNINIVGSLTAASKSFLIDHPSKPGYKLQYGSLEGPEHGVYVRGRQQGSNVILLPDYWVDLVDPTSITVQVTAIGQSQNLYVENIVDNKIYLAATLDPYHMNFFYFIQAERKDIDKLVVEFN